jgi:hypothetical protein
MRVGSLAKLTSKFASFNGDLESLTAQTGSQGFWTLFPLPGLLVLAVVFFVVLELGLDAELAEAFRVAIVRD